MAGQSNGKGKVRDKVPLCSTFEKATPIPAIQKLVATTTWTTGFEKVLGESDQKTIQVSTKNHLFAGKASMAISSFVGQ